MTPIEHNGESYKVIRGSDVQRDGMFLELWSAKNPERLLYEVFYSDITHTYSFACFEQAVIPLEVLEEYLRQSRYLLKPNSDEAEGNEK
jgi:hypothetical protein